MSTTLSLTKTLNAALAALPPLRARLAEAQTNAAATSAERLGLEQRLRAGCELLTSSYAEFDLSVNEKREEIAKEIDNLKLKIKELPATHRARAELGTAQKELEKAELAVRVAEAALHKHLNTEVLPADVDSARNEDPAISNILAEVASESATN
jgi:hypothetical protein